MQITKEQIKEFLPNYLQNNEYFLDSFHLKLVSFDFPISMERTPFGVFFHQFAHKDEEIELLPFSLFISEKGEVEMTGGKRMYEECPQTGYSNENIRFVSVTANIDCEENFAITKRIIITKSYKFPHDEKSPSKKKKENQDCALKSQSCEKEFYDSFGNLKREVRKIYPIQIILLSPDEKVKQDWDPFLPYQYFRSKYYLNTGQVVTKIEEVKKNSTKPDKVCYTCYTPASDTREETTRNISCDRFEHYLDQYYSERMNQSKQKKLKNF